MSSTSYLQHQSFYSNGKYACLSYFFKEQALNQEEPIKVGPWGGQAGTTWSYKPKGEISHIIIGHSEVINSLSFKSIDKNGNTESSKTFGGKGRLITQIALDWPQEYLTSITGTRCTYNNFYVTQSLCLHTNRAKYGPFGHTEGTSFAFSIEDGVIIGFHGRAGIYVNAIGYYVKHSADLFGLSNQVEITTPKEQCCDRRKPFKIGPWGSLGGTHWSYKTNGGITEIIIGHAAMINSLSFKSVDENGKIESSDRFGGDGGVNSKISLDWPREFLTSISWTNCTYNNVDVIQSLCLHTNLTIYGPFGSSDGGSYSFPMERGIIVGFFGSAGVCIDGLGLYAKCSANLFKHSS